jgi:hypothetical protein
MSSKIYHSVNRTIAGCTWRRHSPEVVYLNVQSANSLLHLLLSGRLAIDRERARFAGSLEYSLDDNIFLVRRTFQLDFNGSFALLGASLYECGYLCSTS